MPPTKWLISWLNAKKAHSDAESVIALSVSIIVETMLGSDAADTMSKVPLSNDTILRRIEDLSSDMNEQIREHFYVQGQDDELPQLWALQVDESTDSTGKAHLFAFIRFVKNGSFVNQCLLCKELKRAMQRYICTGRRKHFIVELTVEKLC